MSGAGPVGVVDIGSTSTRLLVTNGGGDRERSAVITGLGRGLGEGGRLDPEAVTATLACLADYAARARAHGAVALRAVATSSLRRAGDGAAFIDRAADVLGVRPEVLSGSDEARLGFRGATRRRDAGEAPFVVVDLGGGSCEFSSADASFSAEFGAARLTEQWIAHDPPAPEELVACLSIVEAHLEDVVRELPEVAAARTWLGVAGTFCTFAAVELGLADYDRERVNGFALSRAAAEDVYRTLVTERLPDRIHNPGLVPERAEVIVGGACAVVAIMRFFGLERMVVSDDDLLDALAADLLATAT